jgi:hypothetical protein
MNLTAGLAYGLVFAFSAIGLLVAARLISGLDATGFVREHEGLERQDEGRLTTSS